MLLLHFSFFFEKVIVQMGNKKLLRLKNDLFYAKRVSYIFVPDIFWKTHEVIRIPNVL